MTAVTAIPFLRGDVTLREKAPRLMVPSQPPLQAIGEVGREASRNRGLRYQVKGVDAAGIRVDLDRYAGAHEAKRVFNVLLEEEIERSSCHVATGKTGNILCQAWGEVMDPVGIDLLLAA